VATPLPVRRSLEVAARALLVGFGLVPFLPPLLARVGPLAGAARALDAWFAFQCERDPARMLGVGAVCARCLGIYAGLGLGALVARPRWRSPWLELWLGAGVLAMLADVGSEALGWRPAWAPLRVLTGLLLSYPAALLLIVALTERRSRPAP